MKIYTKSGDDGTTGLYGNKRVSKGSDVIDLVGDLDELNSYLGVCRSGGGHITIPILETIQSTLFEMGAEIVSVEPVSSEIAISDKDVEFLEDSIDHYDRLNTTLKNFILPGGSSTVASHLFVARAICRRVERKAWRMDATAPIRKYLNRLSDLLFVLSRVESAQELIWKSRRDTMMNTTNTNTNINTENKDAQVQSF